MAAMRSKGWPGIFLAGALLLFFLAGCGKGFAEGRAGSGNQNGKEKVTVALWSDQLTECYGKYLQDKFPDVEFEFYVATNSTDFYRLKEECGNLPDILTIRRFALKDVASWKDSLMDLSDSELANSFYQPYLRTYTYEDGTVNWLPACAEVDSIIVNKTLLDENNIRVPSNYQEFVDACRALQEKGIRPFLSDFGTDYTCLEILQGLSAAQLTSQEGREWRQMYESGRTGQLSEEVWMPVFERMQEFIGYAGITEEDMEGNTESVFEAYKNHQVAMVRGTGEEAIRYSIDQESLLMPYYGKTKEDNWYLTYPAFQVAANAGANESQERRQLIFDIMEAMLDEDGLRHITGSQNMIAYNKGVVLEPSPLLDHLRPYMEENRLYIRLASADMFSCSREAVQGMITGKYPDAKSAFEAFNAGMKADPGSAPVAARIETGYPYAFHAEGGSPAASAVMNTLREEVGTQLLVGQSVNVAGDIAAGDYTKEELRFLTMGESPSILLCEITGGQLYGYLDFVLSTPGMRGSVVNDSTLYVSSGFRMEVKKTDTGYELVKLTADGAELDRAKTYTLAVLGNEALMQKDALAAAGVTSYTKTEAAYEQIIVDRLASKGLPLAEPTDYITLRE